MINEHTRTGCQEQSLDVYRQPEDADNHGHGVGFEVGVKYEAVEDDYDVGDMADKPADVVELHKSIHLADCTAQSLVTSTKRGCSVKLSPVTGGSSRVPN